VLNAPTMKCAMVLMMKDAMTAGIPTVKKNGTIGMKPPIAVDTAADTVDALKAQILRQQPVRCDEAAWSLWGISLAGWNLLASLIMMGCCLAVFLQSRRPLERASLRRGTT